MMESAAGVPPGPRLLPGTEIAKSVRAEVAEELQSIKRRYSGFVPGLAVVQVGDREDSNVYIRMKQKAAEEVGFNFQHVHLPADVSESELLQAVKRLNEDSKIQGILVQLPLPPGINDKKVTESVSPDKDVDGYGLGTAEFGGFTSFNMGSLMKGDKGAGFVSCTPKGCLEILKRSSIPLEGAHCVVVGRSNIVGRPLATLLEKYNATVTLCHSKTKNLRDVVKTADIVFAAIGKPCFIRGDWLKPGSVVVDVGINSVDNAGVHGGKRLVGDVDFHEALEVVSAITPVPGGVGPMTVAMLLQNTLEAAKEQLAHSTGPWDVRYLPLRPIRPTPNDITIAKSAAIKPISEVATEVRLQASELELYGQYKAKVTLDLLERTRHNKDGKYVVIGGINPTPLGEGKSTTLVGLVQALGAHLKKNVFACLRQPSMGPTFGIKGGAAGGGYSQVIPMADFNLHLTGDIHAISAAHNLVAAAIDARYLHESTQTDEQLFNRLVPKIKGKRTFTDIQLRRAQRLGLGSDPNTYTSEDMGRWARLDIDIDTVSWRRVVDINDRFLRGVTIGEGPQEQQFARKTGYDITVASEIMAILALTTDLEDMKQRFGRMIFANNKAGDPLTIDDLGLTGAITVIMHDAIKPNLMQTLEGTPAFVHAGPFANIAHGNSSIIADRIALKLVEEDGYVVTEAGFGADIGVEKFFNIKCRYSGIKPSAAVIVATVRALKMHGGGPAVVAGKPLPDEYTKENLALLREGCANMVKHVQTVRKFGVPVIVAVNQFASDTPAEIDEIRKQALAAGAFDAIPTTHFSDGGAGAVRLAEAVVAACAQPSEFRYLYELDEPIVQKIETIVKEVYGGDGIELSETAKQQIETFTRQGFDKLPICMAKTHLSLSADPKLKGVPQGFIIPIREVRASVGAGFLYPLVGEMSTMPGLPTRPCFFDIDIDTKTGEIFGLM